MNDETSFPQGNRDGRNPKRSKGWLWVLVTPLVSFWLPFDALFCQFLTDK